MLNLVWLHFRLCRDGGKGHCAVVRWTTEYSFGERRQRDLDVEELAVRFEEFVFADVACEHVVGG